jgi:hypothetical protein
MLAARQGYMKPAGAWRNFPKLATRHVNIKNRVERERSTPHQGTAANHEAGYDQLLPALQRPNKAGKCCSKYTRTSTSKFLRANSVKTTQDVQQVMENTIPLSSP